MKLISMTDFLLEQVKVLIHGKDPANIKKYDYVLRTTAYARFLKQPLELWMFVPSDEDGSVLEEPKEGNTANLESLEISFSKYQQAKERCLFEGDFTVKKHGENNVVYLNDSSFYTSWNKSKRIEDLMFLNLKLTPTALKQIGL
jgi:hypothetical protein